MNESRILEIGSYGLARRGRLKDLFFTLPITILLVLISYLWLIIPQFMINEIKISHRDIELIKAELEANKPYEACGVLVGTIIGGSTALVEKALPVTNVKRTMTSFELDPKEQYNAWNEAGKNGREIVGVYHTHPVSSAVPSLWDRETMQSDTSVWLIAGADGMRAYVWENGAKSVKIVEI